MTEQSLVVQEETTPTTVGGFDLVDPEGAKAYWENYEDVVNAILTKDDYQGTQFKKKSAYRKLATAFQFSDEVVKEDIIKDDKGRVVTAEFHVKATAKNGRFAIGVGMCSLYDKISKKDRTEPSEFELRKGLATLTMILFQLHIPGRKTVLSQTLSVQVRLARKKWTSLRAVVLREGMPTLQIADA